mmetsp:Transcript_43326/g.67879  ORF Transcript_43326/g.67879 Transcript_43326/m.67879 type:complete len:414 (-) Transcript_43326:252-1493(-)
MKAAGATMPPAQSSIASLSVLGTPNPEAHEDRPPASQRVSLLHELPGEKSTVAEQKMERIFLVGGITSVGETASTIAWTGNSDIKPRLKDGVPERTADPAKREADLVNYKKFPRTRSSCAAVSMRNRLFVMGGHSQDLGALHSCLSRGKMELNWKPENKMKTRRDGLAVVGFEDGSQTPTVMALGGNNGIQILNSIEMNQLWYNERSSYALSQWVEAPTMSFKRANLAACALPVPAGDPPIFVAGGYTDGNAVLNEVETFAWSTNSWQMERPMAEARASHGIAVLNNRVYVVGGTDGNKSLKTVEAYDRREGIWRKIIPMRFGRVGCAVVQHCGRMVVVGGRQYLDAIQTSEFVSAEKAMSKVDFSYKPQRPKEFIDVVECYDDRAARWDEIYTFSKIKETALDRAHAGHCVL